MKQEIKVLIVEDEVLSMVTLEAILNELGYEVCKSVATGEEAVKSVEKEKPDVVLIDIHLAGKMDGIETVQAIRPLSEPAIIFMTGYSDEALMEQVKNLKPIACLTKPLKISELESTINTVLKN